jgi:hypothetical protein
MQKNIFSIPIFESTIDAEKIIFNKNNLRTFWPSETFTSYNNDTELNEESTNYLLKIIGKELINLIKKPFTVELTNIWENNYIENDFQENHIHTNSHFSFVVYKKCVDSKTKFFSTGYYLIQSFYLKNNLDELFETTYTPKLKENNIIIFPSFLEHMVTKCSNVKTISGNINILPADINIKSKSILTIC